MRARLSLVLVSVLALAGLAIQPALANDAVVLVEIVDEGTLTIGWGEESPAFLVNGESPSLTAYTPSVTATASFSLVIEDTRADESRDGYVIRLQASPFSSDGAPSAIQPGQLTVTGVTGVTGLPDGIPVTTANGQSLDSPVNVLTVPNGAAALDTTLAITVAMTLLPGTMPGAYTGSLIFDLLPWVAP
jgi:hypothetical protein